MDQATLGKEEFSGTVNRYYRTGLMRGITSVNLALLNFSKGKLGAHFMGRPVLLLGTIGCQSSSLRKTPVFYLQVEDKMILVAVGANSEPGWFNNIKVNPDVIVTQHGKSSLMLATPVDEAEQEMYWTKVVQDFPMWANLQEKSNREFPLVILSQREQKSRFH